MLAAQALTPCYFLGVFCTEPQNPPRLPGQELLPPPPEPLLLQGTSPVGTAMQEGAGCRMLPRHCQPPQALGASRASETEQRLQPRLLHLYPLDFPPSEGFRPTVLQQPVPGTLAGSGGALLGSHHCAHPPEAPGGLWFLQPLGTQPPLFEAHSGEPAESRELRSSPLVTARERESWRASGVRPPAVPETSSPLKEAMNKWKYRTFCSPQRGRGAVRWMGTWGAPLASVVSQKEPL